MVGKGRVTVEMGVAPAGGAATCVRQLVLSIPAIAHSGLRAGSHLTPRRREELHFISSFLNGK